jgi:hypothetical protein
LRVQLPYANDVLFCEPGVPVTFAGKATAVTKRPVTLLVFLVLSPSAVAQVVLAVVFPASRTVTYVCSGRSWTEVRCRYEQVHAVRPGFTITPEGYDEVPVASFMLSENAAPGSQQAADSTKIAYLVTGEIRYREPRLVSRHAV